VQLVSKISNLCDPDPPTLQTDRQTDGQHAISIPRYALVHRGVKTAFETDRRTVTLRISLNAEKQFDTVLEMCAVMLRFESRYIPRSRTREDGQ